MPSPAIRSCGCALTDAWCGQRSIELRTDDAISATGDINNSRVITLDGASLLGTTINNVGFRAAITGNGTLGPVVMGSGGSMTVSGGDLNMPSLTGSGLVTGLPNVAGAVTASDGALAFAADIPPSSGLTFEVASSLASILRFNGKVDGPNTVTFQGTLGAVELSNVTVSPGGLNFAGKVSGLHVGDGPLDAGTSNYINVNATIDLLLRYFPQNVACGALAQIKIR